MLDNFHIQILGARGSISVEGDLYNKYGGATSCSIIKVASQIIVLDGGSGIMLLPSHLGDAKKINILLSHFHIDHISGLFSCPTMFDETMSVDIYSKHNTYNKFCDVMRPPAWPVGPEAFKATVNFHDIHDSFNIGDVKITTHHGYHPGGATIYRLEYNNKVLIYATDCEIDENNIDKLSLFAKNADLLLCDGQYDSSQIPEKKGFGHSNWRNAAKLAIASNVKSMGIIHHDPLRTDDEIDLMQEKLREVFPNGFFVSKKEERFI